MRARKKLVNFSRHQAGLIRKRVIVGQTEFFQQNPTQMAAERPFLAKCKARAGMHGSKGHLKTAQFKPLVFRELTAQCSNIGTLLIALIRF